MRLKKAVREELGIIGEDEEGEEPPEEERDELYNHFVDGKAHIIPWFYHTVL